MTRARPSAVAAAVAFLAISAPPLAAQVQRAPAPSAVAPWIALGGEPATHAFPFLGFNDADGVTVGGWVRGSTAEEAAVWVAIGAAPREPARVLTAVEAGAELGAVTAWFKGTEGRRGFGASYARDLEGGWRITLAAEEAALVDDAYLRRIFFFDCPGDAPAAPCDSVRAPYDWSARPDRALEIRAVREPADRPIRWGVALRGAPGALGAEPAYAQARAEALWSRETAERRLDLRLAAGWATRRAPLQSRFFLHGAGPLARWTNPYLRSRGAPFDRISYFAPGGAHLRAYGRTAPLLRRFAAVAAAASRSVELPPPLSGRVGVFVEAAWLPGAPDAYGRDDLHEGSAVLIDWARLTPGEEEAGGRFSAGVLDLPRLLADAGLSAGLTLPYGLDIELSLPLWVSHGFLADRAHDLLDPLGDGEDRALGLRWALTVTLAAPSAPGRSLLDGL